MVNNRQQKWEARYADANASTKLEPATLLVQHKHLLPASGQALDLACGLGDSALWLAQQGFNVSAWDFSANAISLLQKRASKLQLSINSEQKDAFELVNYKNSFDVIVVRRFLERALCDDIAQALKPNGLLFYETFNENKLKESHKMNSAFVLKHGEEQQLFSRLHFRYFYALSPKNLQIPPPKGMLSNSSYMIMQKTG